MRKYEKVFVIISGSIGLLVILFSSKFLSLESNPDLLFNDSVQ